MRVAQRYGSKIDMFSRPIGRKRILCWPTKLAAVRLEREAEKRKTHPDVLLAQIVEILGCDDLYAAILDK